MRDAGGRFLLWLPTPVPDTEFACRLYEDYNVTVLPGSLPGARSARRQPGPQLRARSRWCPPRPSAWRRPTLQACLTRPFLTGKQPMTELQSLIDAAFENRASITPANADPRCATPCAEVLGAARRRQAARGGEDRRRRGSRISGSRRRCCCRSGSRTTPWCATATPITSTRCRPSSPTTARRTSRPAAFAWCHRPRCGAAHSSPATWC